MPERRGSRFVLEVLFLLALAGSLAFAQLDPIGIGGVMLVGWLIVAVLEWTAWRADAHYGHGLPPRYHVPETTLPPPAPVELFAAGYPESHRDDVSTWTSSAEVHAEGLGEWPHLTPGDTESETDSTDEPDPWTVISLPGAPLDERDHRRTDLEPSLDVALVQSVQRVARYSLEPLEDPPPSRRPLRRRGDEPSQALAVPARPEGVRALPGRSSSQD